MSNIESISKSLESDWIEDFEKKDSHYEIFYKENISYVSIHSIYIDRNSNIQTIKEEKFFMREKNNISREELIGILKRNCFHNDMRYTVLSILKYNPHLDPKEVEHFLKSSNSTNYLSVVKNIDEISYETTIAMFQDLNELIIIFYEKYKSTESNNQTKKIIISNPRKKTLRKIA
jgi:hypothetical protein